MAFKIFFKELNESLQGEFQKKIRQAKKGECAGIMKELEAAFKDHKINQNEFDMLTAMTGRKMDKLEEAKEIKSAVLVKNYGDFKKGTKVKVLSFEGSGRYKVEFPDKSTDIIGVSSIAFSVTESTELAEGDVELKVGSACAYRGTKCKVLKALGGNKYEIEYKGKPLNVKMQGMTLVTESEELEENITKDNWANLKAFFKKQSGFKSWSFEDDYEILEIGFKDNISAQNALKKSVNSSNDINAYGSNVTAENGKITVELNKNAMNSLEEAIEGINDTGIGYVISYSMFMIAQTHIWHLLCKSGQKHVALKNFYDELQDEVDELAERFIAQGGILSDVEANLVARYDDFEIVSAFNSYREMVTSCVESRPEMASIVDGIVDLQEIIDSNLYKFNLN